MFKIFEKEETLLVTGLLVGKVMLSNLRNGDISKDWSSYRKIVCGDVRFIVVGVSSFLSKDFLPIVISSFWCFPCT